MMLRSFAMGVRRLSSSAAAAAGQTVGFIGLGQMGLRMARNLGKDTALVVNDINAQAAHQLASELKQVRSRLLLVAVRVSGAWYAGL